VKKSEGKQVEGIFGFGKKDKDKSKDKVKFITIETPVNTSDICVVIVVILR